MVIKCIMMKGWQKMIHTERAKIPDSLEWPDEIYLRGCPKSDSSVNESVIKQMKASVALDL